MRPRARRARPPGGDASARRAPPARRAPSARRALVMWLVLSLAVVMGILFFAFDLAVRQRNAQAHAVYFGEVAHGLAESGVALAWRHLRARRGDVEDPLFDTLVLSAAEDLAGATLELDLEAATAPLLADLGEASLEVEAQVVEATPLDPERSLARGYDPLEKHLRIEVRATGRFRGMRRRVVERRRVRVQLDNLPVLSRFTLFVRRPEVQGAGNPGYNRYANDINGVVDTVTVPREENFLPLVLFNHGDAYPRMDHDPQRNGWVYLGGSMPLRLNLTSGADYLYGQYFHFFNFLVNEESRQPGFLARNPPPFFQRDHLVGGETHRYFVKHVIYGYFTVDRGEPPGDMNRGGLLSRELGARDTLRSNVLHLYGSFIAPSPTRVFGPVYQSYPVYSGVTVDVDGDGRRDGLVSLMPAVDAGGWEELDVRAPIPGRVRSLSRRGETIELDPRSSTWEAMFGDHATYARFMSTLIRREPYNWGVDYIQSRGEFPITDPALDPNRDYPNPGTEVEIRRQDEPGEAGLHFSGNLGQVDGERLARRAVLRFATAEEFRAAFLEGRGPLRLGLPVLIEEGDLELPDRLLVERGGMIACRGNISFDGVTCEDGERLSLVSLGGNITSAFDHASRGDPADVDLVALDGRVACTDPHHELAIHGTLATETLHPEDCQGGGRVVFDAGADPAAPGRSRHGRIHVADAAEAWQL